MPRLDDLAWMTRDRQPDLDYSRGGEVQRIVRQHLTHNNTEWFYRTEIAMRLGLEQRKLGTLLWWMLKCGDVTMMKDARGYQRWRAR